MTENERNYNSEELKFLCISKYSDYFNLNLHHCISQVLKVTKCIDISTEWTEYLGGILRLKFNFM